MKATLLATRQFEPVIEYKRLDRAEDGGALNAREYHKRETLCLCNGKDGKTRFIVQLGQKVRRLTLTRALRWLNAAYALEAYRYGQTAILDREGYARMFSVAATQIEGGSR